MSPTPDPDKSLFEAPLRVLLINDGACRDELLRDALVRQGHEVLAVIASAPLIHDSVVALEPDVVIVDSESPSRDTLEHLAVVAQDHPKPVVVFAEDEDQDLMRRALKAGVSAYVVAGLQPHRLRGVLQVALLRFEQDMALRRELAQALNALDDRKRIERAKGLLMRLQLLSEPDAYRHLQRMAMDRGEKISQVAQRLIDAAELLGQG